MTEQDHVTGVKQLLQTRFQEFFVRVNLKVIEN